MKNILFVLPSLTQTNGVSSFLMNYLKNINIKKFKIEILAPDLRPSEEYLKFLNQKGITVHLIPFIRTNGVIKYLKSIRNFFRENHNYDMIYSNMINQSIFIFHEAKKYGIKELVIHAHATKSSDKTIKRIINNMLIRIVSKQATIRIACSELAGKAMYKKKSFKILNNAIDYDKYKFSKENRFEIRKKLKILDNEIIVGFVGRFVPQKNIFFFKDLAECLNNNYRIMMIGTGEQKEEFLKKLEESNIIKKFIFIEECGDVNKYYSAMDIFVLPSFYEGLPVVSIEAQASGLNCLLSDNITQECRILKETLFLPINNKKLWLDNCLNYKKIDRSKIIMNDKFNIKIQNKNFENIINNR